MLPFRVGHVRYLNARPLVEGLESLEGLDLVPAAPADLIDLLVDGRVDAALVSTADLACAPVPLAVLRAGMIGSAGPIMTVRLLSRVPFESITTLHADAESHTSIALARLLLAERGSDPDIVPARIDGSDWPEALLAIGDKVITTPPPPGLYPHCIDLGGAWADLTGLPMVYAAWACHADRAHEAWTRTAECVLDRQRRHNATRLGAIAAKHAAAHGWDVATAARYFTEHVRYELDDHAADGLNEFLDRCAQRGILPNRPLRWAAGLAPSP